MRILPALGLLLALSSAAWAIGVDEPLPDAGLEARAHEISRELRCLVCQNQSIEDSDAPLAADLRRIVRERVVAGDSDEAIKAYLVARYGEWVLLRPPFQPATWVLWLGPFVLLASAVAVIAWRRRRGTLPVEAPAPLSADEAARLADLLDEKPSPGDRA
ncbi:cytochrome c-type biogenesis protein [Oleomonas cavernae]|uniref:cytochrome c-type biogenesis protein n=1 Tax=Oleomonas cavernae TaxID=2320859 RepID=UPI0018F55F8F|nr:cytochrome c-type biogenesis protein [Oleomonas cavernae]